MPIDPTGSPYQLVSVVNPTGQALSVSVQASNGATVTPLTTAGTVAASASRKGLGSVLFANTSNVTWYVKEGVTSGTPSAADCSFDLPAGAKYETPGNSQAAFRCAPASAVGSGALNVTERT